MEKLKRLAQSHLVSLVVILLSSLAISYLFGFWFGYPRGHDALFHLFKSNFISQNWPHHHWWNIWAGGMPLLLYYPPLPHYLLALTGLITHAPLATLLAFFAFLAAGLTAYGLYLLVFQLTKKKLFSLISALLYLTCPSSWAMTISSGVYVRALAMPFFIFGLYFSIQFWQKFKAGTDDQRLLKAAALFWGLTLLVHQYIALIGYATLAFFTFFVAGGKFSAKVVTLTKMVLLALFLAASFLLPLLKFFPKTPTTSWISPLAQKHIPLKDLVPLPVLRPGLIPSSEAYDNFHRLSPFLLPLAILLTILFFLTRIKKPPTAKLKPQTDFSLQVVEFSGWMTLLWLTYSTGNPLRLSRILPFVKTAYSFLGTRGATYFLPIFLSLNIGLLLSFLLTKRRLISLSVVGFLIAGLAFFMKEENKGITAYLRSETRSTQIESRDFTSIPPTLVEKIDHLQDKNFRLGLGAETKIGLGLNYALPGLPQTGHYFAPGVANFELYYYFEDTLWQKGKNENEIRFLLDWWAIKPILTYSNSIILNKSFLNRVDSQERFTLASYQESSPLLSPTQAPVVLVIGSQKGYQDSFFRALAVGNLGPNAVIPISGKSRAEDYSWKELSSFDLVFLYDYQVNNPLPGMAKILNTYVKNGGRLIIESNRDLESSQTLPDPFPIKKVTPSFREKKWNFKIKTETSYLTEADLAGFSPAQYEDGPWGMAEGAEVKEWAKPTLTSDGKPILVEGKLGKGKVLWSGINLPFHIVNSQNSHEAQALKRILHQFTFTPSQDSTQFKADFKNSQERTLTLQGETRGVLFKENFFPNWQARAKTAQKNIKLKIYPAGPGFMFAYLPKGTKEVTFLYRRSWIEKVADLVSLLTFSYLILSLVRPPSKVEKTLFGALPFLSLNKPMSSRRGRKNPRLVGCLDSKAARATL